MFYPSDILLPKNIDMKKWSVVACDQFTSEPKYWEETKKEVGDSPSTLNLIFPEIYLSENTQARINSINKKMKEYIDRSLFCEYKNTYIITKRTLKNGKVRTGLIGAVDLEDYDFYYSK